MTQPTPAPVAAPDCTTPSEFQQMLAPLRQALDASGRDIARALTEEARAFSAAGDFEAAISRWHVLLALFPEQRHARDQLAKAYRLAGRGEQAIAFLEASQRLGHAIDDDLLTALQQESMLQHAIATLLERLGPLYSWVNVLDRYIPGFAPLSYTLAGDLVVYHGAAPEPASPQALSHVAEALEQIGFDATRQLYNAGWELAHAGAVDASEVPLQLLRALDPDDIGATMLLARICFSAERWADARFLLEHAKAHHGAEPFRAELHQKFAHLEEFA